MCARPTFTGREDGLRVEIDAIDDASELFSPQASRALSFEGEGEAVSDEELLDPQPPA